MAAIETSPETLRLVRCPACRLRLSGEEPEAEPCRRCQADLRSLRRACAAAADHQRRARRALAAGEALRARHEAHAACQLLDAPALRATLAAALVAVGREREALALISKSGS